MGDGCGGFGIYVEGTFAASNVSFITLYNNTREIIIDVPGSDVAYAGHLAHFDEIHTNIAPARSNTKTIRR
jgi:hypothetical protein